MLRKILKISQLMLVIVAVFSASMAHAQTTSGSDLCSGDALAKLFCSTDLTAMLNQVFQLSIALGGVLAILRIGYAGWLYMGREDMWSTKTHAKEVFRDAIIGLLVLLSIWLILYQINPDILNVSLLKSS